MTRILFISFCAILLKDCSGDLTCDLNEVVSDCPRNCATQYCPKNENYDHSCRTPEKRNCPPKACECRFNHKRHENGTCIPTTECPKFECDRVNEEYVACPSYCPSDDCSQATPDGRCPFPGFILFVVECQPACRCIKNHWRKNGVCVSYKECPTVNRVI